MPKIDSKTRGYVMKWSGKNLLFVYFVLTLLLVAMIYGFAVGRHRIYPFHLFDAGDRLFTEARMAARDWMGNWGDNLDLKPTRQLRPATRPGSGVVIHDRQAMEPGPTLITGFWDDHVGIKLLAGDGAILHEWEVAYRKLRHAIGDDSDDFNVLIHGAILLPDGGIAFNYDGHALVRMNRCGEVSWILPEHTHHSLFLDEKGHFWVPIQKVHDEQAIHYRPLDIAYYENFVTEVAPDGAILRQWSVIDAFYKSGLEADLFNGRWNHLVTAPRNGQIAGDPGEGSGAGAEEGERVADLTHLNSVAVLQERDAARFPMFQAGDILVSLRMLNMLAVIRPDSGRIVWTQTGPFRQQHDAQFLADGTILLFDNRSDGAGGRNLGGSRIAVIDPATRKVTIGYQGDATDPFYSQIGGKVQRLGNGNLLITDFDGGRAFEVTPGGKTVWEFINRYDETHVARITQATRYPPRFAELAGSACR
ncbi:arylsulfotransferase family protein [Endothiovibrio diazotrophicus]